MAWLISIPVWGDVYFRTFERVCAPALRAAVSRLGAQVQYIVHTDQPPARVRAALLVPGVWVEVRRVPSANTYVTLQESHADAVAAAAPGDHVVLLNADLVVSGNLLTRCAEHFAVGKQAVVLLGIRTVAGPQAPPAGAAPRALLSWAWDHRHQIIRDLEWPAGGSMLPTNLFFSEGESTVARGFHLHPVAIVKQANTTFRSTIDGDLLDCFPREAVHVVVDPDDCSMCEVSEPTRRFPVRAGGLSPSRVAASMRSRASPMHCWLFTHRIVVRGRGEDVVDDVAAAQAILTTLRVPLPPPSLTPLPRGLVRPAAFRGAVPGGRRGRRPSPSNG